MVINNRLFPYPVLAEETDDYREGYFKTTPEIVEANDDLNYIGLRFKIDLDNAGLKNLVNQDKAEFVIHIECPYTSYRDIIRTQSDEHPYKLPKKSVNVKVMLLGMLVAKQDIHYYRNGSLNSDYDDIDIHLKKGSILAYYNMAPLNINKNYEELTTSDAIFTICRYDRASGEEHNPIRFELTDEKIRITVDEDIYKNFARIKDRPDMKPLVMTSFVLPALMYTIETLRTDEETLYRYQSAAWFMQINKLYKSSGKTFVEKIDDETTPAAILAQEILKNPISDFYTNIHQILEG